MSRSQTTLDFAIGVSIFLIVVSSVLAFVPAMLKPFEASIQQETTVGDRAAQQIVAGMLAAPETPYVIKRECTVVFFEDESADTSDADIGENTDADGSTSAVYDDTVVENPCPSVPDLRLRDRLAIAQPGLNIRVSVHRDLLNGPTADTDTAADVLCLNAGAETIIEAGDPTSGDCDVDEGDDDVVFAIGEPAPTKTGSLVVARRTVQIRGGLADGTADSTLLVEVW